MIFNNGGYKIQLLNIEYGIQDNYTNITEYVSKNFIKNNVLHIEKTIDLNKLFGDPITFVEKHIKIRLLINDCVLSLEENLTLFQFFLGFFFSFSYDTKNEEFKTPFM